MPAIEPEAAAAPRSAPAADEPTGGRGAVRGWARAGPWIVFVAALVVHRENLGRALLGWDTYATLAASRIASPSDLVGTFGEKLMDGRLAFGDFYRPVGNLVAAFDYALWGLRPFGHQLTSTLFFAAACGLVFVVVRQRQRSFGVVPAAWAAALVVLHPASLSILPGVARRTETLMVVFVLAALAAAGGARASAARRSAGAALFALLAVGSKEPGLVVLPLLLVDRFLVSGAPSARTRAARALRFVAPACLAVLAFGVLRIIVLAGIGGYLDAPESPYLLRLATHVPAYVGMVVVTGSLEASPLGGPAAWIAATALGLGCGALWRWRSRPDPSAVGTDGSGGHGPGAGLLFASAELALPVLGLVWIGFQLALASTAAKPEPRYVEGLVVGLALVVAGLVDRSRVRSADARAAGRPRCRRAEALLLAAAVVTCGAIAGAPLWCDYPSLDQASALEEAELAELGARIAAGPLEPRGERVRLRKLVPSTAPVVDHAWMLSPWGLQAWLELVFADRAFSVEQDLLVRPEPTHWNLVIRERTADEQ